MDPQVVLETLLKEFETLRLSVAELRSQAFAQPVVHAEALSGEIGSIKNSIAELQHNATISAVQAQTSPVQYVVTEAMPLPDKFSGTRASYSVLNFRLGVQRVFENSPNRFVTDPIKINFIGNLLEGNARRWLDSVLLCDSSESMLIRTDLPTFWATLERHFGIKPDYLASEIKLIRFSQGKMSVADFNTRFRQLASSVKFNDFAFLAIYVSALNSETYAHFRRLGSNPTTLEQAMDLCRRVDVSGLDSTVTKFSDREMQVDVLTSICNYCKLPGHFVKSCPKLVKKTDKPSAGGMGKGLATRH